METALSDLHEMVVTVMKTHFQKTEPKIIQHKDYSNFPEKEYQKYISIYCLVKI